MKCAKIIIMIVIFVFAMSVSCAADTNNASISEDNSQMLLSLKNEITDDTSENSILAQTNNVETLSAQKNSEILQANEGTYSELRNVINYSGILTKSYYRYEEGDGETIVIDSSFFTVNGNGAVIDMEGSNIRAFEVTGYGVTFKNLTIKNAIVNGNGGAIFFSNGGTVTNCNFTNNKAIGSNSWGGAIWMNFGTVSNCNFNDNTATVKGGAIWMFSGSVENCNFTGNTATGTDSRGGAVYFQDNGNVENCNFTANTATRGDGGAVYFDSYGNVGNCNFTANTATTGSAIYFYSTSVQKYVSNSTFLNNRANAKDLQVTKNENNITIIFTGNNNLLNAIYSDDDVSFSNVTYWGANGIVNTDTHPPSISNNAAGQSITVEIYGSDDNLVENVTLVTDDKGQATYDFIKLRNGEYKYKAYHIEDCYYTYAEYKDTFTLNSDLGDFNRLQKYINGASENSILTLCRDYTFIGSDENLVNGIVIDKPLTINGNGYAINALQKARIFNVTAGNVVLNNIAFTNATASGDGGAIYFSESGTVENCNFTGNTATGSDSGGGAVFFDGEGTVSNCNFTGNNATYAGGAVYIGGTGDVRNCNFTDNFASGNGGAIRMTSGSVTNCNFTGNKATRGGAVYFVNNGNVTNCNFNDNTATLYGGAVYFTGTGDVTNCNFTGNTATVRGGAVYFNNQGNVLNCNFTGNKALGSDSDGGAIWMFSGTVSNCNFTDNQATVNGGAIFTYSGTVRNCNFTGNTATGDGGAIWMSYGTVSNCNFTGNTATCGGAVFFAGNGIVGNCNFTNNKATGSNSWGGAIYMGSGTVENCNFSNNNATIGSAIYFGSYYYTNSVSNSIFLNNRANAKDLQVIKNENNITIIFTGNDNILNAIYSNRDVSFSNVTYWGANGIVNTDTYNPSISNNAAGQNITIKGVVNGNIINTTKVTDENGEIVLDDAGDYWIIVSHKGDSYYTEVAERLFTNMSYNVNITSQTTNNKTVNITAKSNIFNEVMPGKLLFILPNSTQINANYTSNGTWWAVHEFDDAGDYIINASYIGLDGVIINNATISIRYDASVDVNNKTLDLLVGDTFTIVANTTPKGLNVTYVPDDSGVYDVDKSGVVTALKNGTGSVLVKIDGDGVYAENSTIVTVTVTKVPTEIKVTNTTLNLEVNGEIPTGATLSPDDAGNLTYNLSNEGIVKIEDGKIIALKEGNVTITVSFKGNNKYLTAENKTINVTVTLKNARVSVNNNTLDLFVDNTFTIVANTTPKGLKVTYKPDNSGIISVDNNGVVKALKEGNTTIIVSVGDNKVYAENTTTVTVTVRKIPTEILITNETLDLKVNDKVDSGASLNPSEAGNLTYTISETSIIKLLDNQIIALSEGSTTITYSFAGNDKYAAAQNKTITVKISLNDTSVRVNNNTLNLLIDDTFTIIATTVPDGLNVTYMPDNSGIISIDENGLVTALKEGTALIIVKVGGDGVYAENTTTVTVTVNKISTDISIANATVNLNVDDEVSTGAKLNPEEAGNLSYTSSDENIAIVKDGKIIALKEGDAIITVSFKGNNKYGEAKNKTIKVTVKKLNPSMNITADEITEGENATINVELPIDATGNVTTIVNGKTYSSLVDNGKAIITIPDLIKGDYTLPVTYSGDDKYNSLTKDVNLTVKEDEIVVSAPDLTKYYSSNERFNVNVTYANGRAIAGKEVKITINGVTYTRTTDENGTASLSINLNSGEYPVTVAVDDVVVNSTVTVKATIDASDIVKVFGNDTQYYATFTDVNGTPVANTTVSFNVNGVSYNRTTDENGTAKLNINLPQGEYVLTATNTETGEKISNVIKVLSFIESADLTKYFRNESQFVVRIHTADGGYVGAGEEVKFNINGKIYTRTTNATGHAKLNINMGQGNYTITTYYKEYSQANNIEVLPILSASNLKMKYMDGSQFKAQLVDGQGNPYTNKYVTFNVNGIFYNRLTDSDGVAKLNIRLPAGEYIITSSYNGCNIANKITIGVK